MLVISGKMNNGHRDKDKAIAISASYCIYLKRECNTKVAKI